MRYVKPYYFEQFKCAAHKCPDTCCAGWQIMIDEDTLEAYMQEKGSFAGRLAKGIDWTEGSFRQQDGRCAMLNEDNLCDLVISMGEDCLCETCHRYPRHVEEFEGLREWSLSLSCPVAAHMILEAEEPLGFLAEEDDLQDPLEEEFEDFDLLLFTQLEDARKVLFRMATDRSKTMEERLWLLLEMARQMQNCVDEDRLFDMDELIASYEGKVGCVASCGGNCDIQEHGDGFPDSSRFRELRKQFAVFERLERLREEWSHVITQAQDTLYREEDVYLNIRRRFRKEYVDTAKQKEQWEKFQENLIVFFLYTYFCGAVYDDWIYTKAALAVFSLLFIEDFIMCRWYLSGCKISLQECVELAYRYAREVEHSDENLNFLEEWLQENPLLLKGTEH